MSSLRLALVTETYPPEINGVAMTIGRLVHGLRERGHRVDIWRPRQQGETEAADVLLPGLSLPGYPELRLGLPAKSRLIKHWRRQRPDVVHVVTEGPLGWSALAAARQLKLPVSSGFHTNFDRYSAHYGLGLLRPAVAAYLRAFHRRAQTTQVPTEALAAELAGQGIPGVRVVGRGVDTLLFNPARRSAALRASWQGTADDSLVCLYAGRLAAEKNLDQVLASFRAIQVRQPRARMLWVGDGPARSRLQAEHPQHLFAGMRQGEDLATHFASADLFLFASLTETYGNVVAEAMASGLAVIAYKSAAAAELIADGVNGRALPPGDADAFTAAAVTLAEDDLLRHTMGRKAYDSLAQHSWAGVVDRFEAVLRGVVTPLPAG
jgi:glycosyltransferase involved in cell wall biosynthesis